LEGLSSASAKRRQGYIFWVSERHLLMTSLMWERSCLHLSNESPLQVGQFQVRFVHQGKARPLWIPSTSKASKGLIKKLITLMTNTLLLIVVPEKRCLFLLAEHPSSVLPPEHFKWEMYGFFTQMQCWYRKCSWSNTESCTLVKRKNLSNASLVSTKAVPSCSLNLHNLPKQPQSSGILM
jgi:hypothetical protein